MTDPRADAELLSDVCDAIAGDLGLPRGACVDAATAAVDVFYEWSRAERDRVLALAAAHDRFIDAAADRDLIGLPEHDNPPESEVAS